MNKILYIILSIFIIYIASASAYTFNCYQETANSSNIYDGYCMLNYSGVYTWVNNPLNFINDTNVIDGDWNTWGRENDTIIGSARGVNINYSKPIGANNNSELTIRINDTYLNLSLKGNNCFDYKASYLQVGIGYDSLGDTTYVACRYSDFASSVMYNFAGKGRIYEEAMNWKFDVVPQIMPQVNIYNPSNNSNVDNNQVNLNFSITGDYITDIWFTNNSGITNTTLNYGSINPYCYMEVMGDNYSNCNVTGAGYYESYLGEIVDSDYSTYNDTLLNNEVIYFTYALPNNYNLANSYWQVKDSYGGSRLMNISLWNCTAFYWETPQVYALDLGVYIENSSGNATYTYYCFSNNSYPIINYSIEPLAPVKFYEEALYIYGYYQPYNLTTNLIYGNNNLRIYTKNVANTTSYDDITIRSRSITTNLSSYSNYIRDPFTISINTQGFLNNVTCSAYSNDTRVNCGQALGNTISCSYNATMLNASVNITPYCYDDAILNATSKVLNIKYGYLDKLSLFVYDAGNYSKLTQAVTVRITSNSSDNTYLINNGALNITDVLLGSYQFRFNVSTYTTQRYDIVINQQLIQNVSAYLILNASTYTTIFTVKDGNTNILVPDCLLSMYSLNNNEWLLVNSLYTDISGKAVINYIQDNQYKFILSKPLYQNNLFYLNPILYSTYDVNIYKSATTNSTQNLYQINVQYPESIAYNGSVTNFNVLFNSPYGSLIAYGYSIDYPVGQAVSLGSNPFGSNLYSTFTITAPSVFSKATLNYWYATSLETKNISVDIPIVYNNTRGTFAAIKNQTYGLGTFERILVAVIISIFIVGIATMLGQLLAGFGLGLVIMAYLTVIGFIPIWAVALSIIIGLFILTWRTGGY